MTILDGFLFAIGKGLAGLAFAVVIFAAFVVLHALTK